MIAPAGRPRVVLDCNVFVQALLNDMGPSGRVLHLVEENRIDLFVSRALLTELRLVLHYPKVQRKMPASLDDDRIDAFIRELVYLATCFRTVPHVFDYPRAKKDEPYIDLAIAVDANALVSRDTDILSLATDHSAVGKEFRQRTPHLKVCTPVDFLQHMGLTI